MNRHHKIKLIKTKIMADVDFHIRKSFMNPPSKINEPNLTFDRDPEFQIFLEITIFAGD